MTNDHDCNKRVNMELKESYKKIEVKILVKSQQGFDVT